MTPNSDGAVPNARQLQAFASTLERAQSALELSRELSARARRARAARAQAESDTERNSVRMALSERLSVSEARFSALVAVAGHVSWSARVDGAMLPPQLGWCTYTGQSAASLRLGDGSGWLDAIHPDERAGFTREYRRAITGGLRFECEVRIRHVLHDLEEWRENLLRVVPVRDSEGNISEWVGASFDITEYVRARAAAEQNVAIAMQVAERARDEADAARHVAEAATAAKGRALAAASHDLRTPLASIANYAEALLMGAAGALTEQQRHIVERMLVADRHLTVLANDIVRAAQAESADLRLVTSSFMVSELDGDLETLTATVAAQHGVHYESRLAESPPMAVRADRSRVLQILVNLVGNAAKFTGAGGRITVDGETDDARVRLCVRDTGPGIAETDREAIFRPYVQLDEHMPALEDGERGVGLGLAISRAMARRMGGELSVEGILGLGATFVLSLPRADIGELTTPTGVVAEPDTLRTES